MAEHCWHPDGDKLDMCCFCGQNRLAPQLATEVDKHGEWWLELMGVDRSLLGPQPVDKECHPRIMPQVKVTHLK